MGNLEDGAGSAHRNAEALPEANMILHLLRNVGKKVGSVAELTQLVEHVTKMTQHALNASASSVLLLDDTHQELFFEIAEGRAGKQLKQSRLSAQSGIAGWVVRNGKPLIVNDVAKDPRFDRGVDKTTGFVTKSVICVPLVVQRKIIGVIEVLNKRDGSIFGRQDLETLVSVSATAAMALENARLNQAILDAYKSTIRALAAAIDAKDNYTRGHSQRVTEYALIGANSLSFSVEEQEVIEYAGILHDVGKIGIPDSILSKPGALTDDEWKVMRGHSWMGANILSEVPFLEKPRELILHHHERYDGKGYPEGLSGEGIPIGARLIAVADAFDTMTTDRSYRTAGSIDSAVSELHRCSRTQFCPTAVDAFITGMEKQLQHVSS